MKLVLEPGEKIIAIARKHWFFIILKGLLSLLAVVAAMVILIGFNMFAGDSILIAGNMMALFLFILSAALLFVVISFFIFWTTYYLDYWVITNHRVIDMDVVSLFSENVATIRMDQIEDIIVETRGIFSHLFKFGTLHLQSAGAEREFLINHIDEPSRLKELIYRLHSEAIEEPQKVHVVPAPTTNN